MQDKKPWIGVQLHFGQPFDLLNPEKPVTMKDVYTAFSKLENVLDIDAVLIGFNRDPFIYDRTIKIIHDMGAKAYLWYGILADFGENLSVPQDAYAVNYLGEVSAGWGKIQSENFQFICPNHPFMQDILIPEVKELIKKHDFDGAFLDRIRYPSVANGLENLFCCFCERCQKKASAQGIDLINMKTIIRNSLEKIKSIKEDAFSQFVEMVEINSPLDFLSLNYDFTEFYRFREECVISIVKDIYDEMHQKEKKVGLDLFSPCLSPLVSQNYKQLSNYGDWIKSMSYCYGKGPASIPFEVSSLIESLHSLNQDLTCDTLDNLMGKLFGVDSLFESYENKKIGPVTQLLINEINHKARQVFNTEIPVYPGFEAINLPGICSVGEYEIEQYLEAFEKGNFDGFILCWTLPLIAQENIQFFANYVNRLND